jgi:hypothetical protein
LRTIIKIEGVTEHRKGNEIYYRTHALITDDIGNIEEAVGYGSDYKVGDKVEYFHHYGQNKMRKGNKHSLDNS